MHMERHERGIHALWPGTSVAGVMQVRLAVRRGAAVGREVGHDRLKQQGAVFRNEIVTGVGGQQILLEDPSGNPVELFEPTRPEARLSRPS